MDLFSYDDHVASGGGCRDFQNSLGVSEPLRSLKTQSSDSPMGDGAC